MNFLVLFKTTDKWSDTWFMKDGSLGCNSEQHIEIVHSHFGYMHQLHGEGKILSGGPTLMDVEINGNKHIDGAMFRYKTESEKETRNLAENDPFIKEMVMAFDFIKPFIAGI